MNQLVTANDNFVIQVKTIVLQTVHDTVHENVIVYFNNDKISYYDSLDCNTAVLSNIFDALGLTIKIRHYDLSSAWYDGIDFDEFSFDDYPNNIMDWVEYIA